HDPRIEALHTLGGDPLEIFVTPEAADIIGRRSAQASLDPRSDHRIHAVAASGETVLTESCQELDGQEVREDGFALASVGHFDVDDVCATLPKEINDHFVAARYRSIESLLNIQRAGRGAGRETKRSPAAGDR